MDLYYEDRDVQGTPHWGIGMARGDFALRFSTQMESLSMQVRAPLMIEHRLIERMLALINKEAMRIRETKVIDPVFIDNAVDFIRLYADKTHHGKEEDILFRDLAQKDMTSEEQKIMGELIQEHVLGRKTVADLVDAKKRHFAGDDSAVDVVIEKLEFLITLTGGNTRSSPVEES